MRAIQWHPSRVSILSPVGPTNNVTKLKANEIVGAVETTNFGYQFVIKNVEDAHNLAFDNIGLQHHTDFTYCRKCPDVALFHCLNNADEGGDSLWLDGFKIAEALKVRKSLFSD
jgi:gamma-butyrobetaine dioxygenase